ncbi:AAA family ATPase [Rhodococcus pyridinivorans]|uniref:AAA family ATPase n=1 Tax=Rhodococcus pyridinivorans TaxID=103816 RepID=UPI00222646E4|nr:AAA family ATPase [Rhodococcus pyridinivorans]MCW3472276.1 AAA family ATPase [Rhodococcus pyridinivorans]
MLRRLDIKQPWRSLGAGFWPEDLPLGGRTVVYGHNGSGKSTLAELMLSLAEGNSAIEVIWEDENLKRTPVSSGGSSLSPSMAVFTRKWVEANLSDFLDGDSASAIVTLGEAAIHAKEEEQRLEAKIEGLRNDVREADKELHAANQKIERLAREVQDRITSELKAFDYNHFTRNRYSIPRIKEDLRKYKGDFPDADAHADALKRLSEGAPAAIAEVAAPPEGVVGQLTQLSELLVETPTRMALKNLEGSPTAQSWVEQGLALHGELEHCLFCAGAVGDERRRELALHFDASWLDIRGRSKKLLIAVRQEREALEVWSLSFPEKDHVISALQAGYGESVRKVRAEAKERIGCLEIIERALESKVHDPSATPEVPDWSILTHPLSVTGITSAIAEHNDQARRIEDITAEKKSIVLGHLVGSQSQAFLDLEVHAKEVSSKRETGRTAEELACRALEKVRQEQFTTKEMADKLTGDLTRVYGKNHLSIAVTDDGKSYACRRSDRAATNLSEGERTTLSLLYFLRKLEDEQVPGGDRTHRIVIIDDPSSSLDREALFATHQWLIDTLKGFGQYVVLTHDFGLLRLFLKSQKNAWGASMKRLRSGDVEETRFPKVTFLEMFAAEVDGARGSRLGKLPSLLLNSTSEYAYLFSMVMAGVADSEDHERLFLLPNAARRVLEVFASYKAPHLTDFLPQLEALVQTEEGEPFRDVYDFCNRYSHGEGTESVDVLDARAVHGQIRRCMELLRAIDAEHFERMCKAAKIDKRHPLLAS